MKKIVLLAFVLAISSMSISIESIKPVEAQGTIYIRADGSIEGTTRIMTVDNATYNFTDNVYDSIVVERDDIVVDGAGYAVQATGAYPSTGIDLSYRSNVTLKNLEVTNFTYGIFLSSSSNNVLTGNIISNNDAGISLWYYSNNNIFIGNTVSNNLYGIYLVWSRNNTFFLNNLIDNTLQAFVSSRFVNIWDDAYPSGGNYWSDYNGTDDNQDGIGETPYVIDENNEDNYPLMGMFSDFKATSEHHVQTVCNSTISDFQFNGTAIGFNVSGEDGTTGFCRIVFPTALMNQPYSVLVNGTEVSFDSLPFSNSTHIHLYFIYNHSTQEVVIVPELPTWTTILFIIILLTAAIAFSRRRLLKALIH